MKYTLIANDVKLGKNVKIFSFTNLYGCEIGDDSKIGTFVEIQKSVKIGKKCKISSHTFICSGVTIGDECFIGHGVMFINDKKPRSTNESGELETEQDWSDRYIETKIGNKVTIGSNATIMGGITIGDRALIGAGAVVTKNIQSGKVVVGNPSKEIKNKY
jgi:UDP-2-acetamido-3-amino-2,3-dideoxy-glucuronate N-acetyltransferase